MTTPKNKGGRPRVNPMKPRTAAELLDLFQEGKIDFNALPPAEQRNLTKGLVSPHRVRRPKPKPPVEDGREETEEEENARSLARIKFLFEPDGPAVVRREVAAWYARRRRHALLMRIGKAFLERRHNRELQAKAIELLNDNHAPRAIAKELGKSTTWVYAIINRLRAEKDAENAERDQAAQERKDAIVANLAEANPGWMEKAIIEFEIDDPDALEDDAEDDAP